MKNNYKHIDYDKLHTLLSTKDDWYLEIQDFLKEHFFNFPANREGKPDSWFEESEEFFQLITEMLQTNTLKLSQFKYGLDKMRKPIDTIVIHHSSRDPNVEIEYLEQALTLVRIYAKAFSNPQNRFYGKAISSDHFHNDKMTFMPYHYLILPDGTVINHLKDEYIGWHCGNSDYNARSIAICFHGDFFDHEPTKEALKSAKELIGKYEIKEILPHYKISTSTTCPGNTYDEWVEYLV